MNFKNLGNTCVVGLQWGDEGKGKIVDILTEHFRWIVRYAGGANAGHTVRIGRDTFALHLIPSGILRPDVTCVIAPGVVVDPEALLVEIEGLIARGIRVSDNLVISDRAHVVMPYHKKQDQLSEKSLGPGRQIGTTARGIGPCYADKMLRHSAIRIGDLLRPDALKPRLIEIVAQRNRLFAALYGDREPFAADEMARQFATLAERIRPHVADTTTLLHNAIAADQRLLFEGAQGTLLDVDHGTYPFVTSSNCGVGGVSSGAGVAPRSVRSVVGVMKAYCTRVGSGPFPTELNDATGERIRERGHEYGTTTGRPRRCGWFDAVAARYCVALSGVTDIALMHLDTLATFDEIRICTGYVREGRRVDAFKADVEWLAGVQPAYESLPGWDAPEGPIDRFEQLPDGARQYVERLERLLNVPITLVSVGADRSATLHRTSTLTLGT